MPIRRPGPAALITLLLLMLTTACGLHSDVQSRLAREGRAPAAVDAAGNPLPPVAGGAVTPGPGVTNAAGQPVVPGTAQGPAVPGPGAVTASAAPGGSSGAPTIAGSRTTLFSGKENTVGISASKIVFCVHAALTYGKAFNTTPDEFNVHWQEVNSKGGIYGRQVEVTYENDNYSPDTAVQAATACRAKNPFFLLGGIGFDQIPAVRNYVEKVHLPYLHHSATIMGTKGQRYSFSASPTVERVGDGFAAITALRFHGKKVGIIGRDSPNWEPGTAAYRAGAKKYGFTIVAESKVTASKGNYIDEILNMKNHGAEVVFTWENAVAGTEIVKQASAQNYHPGWVVFGANLMSQTLGDDALKMPMVGAAMNSPYSYGDYAGVFGSYAADMKQFEAEYKKWKPSVDLTGVSGDLLFWNWSAQKGFEVLLRACGKDCTRNRFIDVFTTFHGSATPSGCAADFSGDGYHGSDKVDYIEAFRAPSGKVDFRPIRHCVGPS